jgi:hypothetical protein
LDEVAYAVHTSSCVFMLDAEGICRWIVSRTGMVPPEVRRCVGAQFVASMHPDLEGGLAGELLVGAPALFVRHDPDTGRLRLLRTSVVRRVEERGLGRRVRSEPLTDDSLGLAGATSEPTPEAVSNETLPPPPPSRLPMRGLPPAYDREVTVTVTLPGQLRDTTDGAD